MSNEQESKSTTSDEGGGGKPRGMAVAKARARTDAMNGKAVSECPYKALSWRSVWLKEFERAQQIELFS